MPNVNASYWLLTVLAAQLYMLMYLLMFSAAIYLRYRYPKRQQGFMIPGGFFGLSFVASLGLIGTTFTFIIGFVPPPGIPMGSLLFYDGLLVTSLLVMLMLPLFYIVYLSYKKAKLR
jgi:amino acid transporter